MNARVRWLAEHVLPHEPELRRWLSGRVPGGVEVDDVVQEAYALLAGLAEVDDIREPRAYLFTTARSIVLQLVRRARVVSFETVAELDRFEAEASVCDPERRAVSGEELRRIAALILSLPEKCRQAFVLRRIHGLSQREISMRMGISENTVEKHIVKGLRVLMDGVKDAGRSRPAPAGRMEQGKHGRKTGED